MQISHHSSDFCVKTFAATSTGEMDGKIGSWQDSNPDAFVIGMEMSSHWNDLNKQVVYVVLMTYRVGEEKDGL